MNTVRIVLNNIARSIIETICIVAVASTACAGQDAIYDDSEAQFRVLATEYGSTLFFLAGEKFAANKRRGETWFFTIHDWTKDEKVIRYTDGKFIVVSLPNMTPTFDGYCKFIHAYHSFNLHEADLKARQGEYGTAMQWYRFLLHFDICGSLREDIKRRTALIDQIQRKDDADKAKETLAKLASDVPYSPLAGIDSEPAKTVANLLDVPVSKAYNREPSIEK